MPAMFVKQHVADYEQWKDVFDKRMASPRQQYGLTVTGVYRRVDEPDTVLVALEMPDLQRGRQFAKSAVLDKGRGDALAGERSDAEVWFSDEKLRVR